MASLSSPRSTRRSRSLAPLLVLLPAAAQEPVRVQFDDRAIPSTEAKEERAAITLRVVDGITGAPLAGAELFAIPEQKHPIGGEFVASATARTDADGFGQLPVKTAWVMARAPGYGPAMEMDQSDRVIALAPAVSVPVQFRDWRGAPLAGYLAGFCGGCGHTCDLVTAITDRNGIAVLPDVDPGNGIADAYLAGAPISFSYDDVRWEPGAPPVQHVFGPGVIVHGTLLDTDGTPAANAIVGLADKHRGPWTRADADGRFVLGGLDDTSGFFVFHRGRQLEMAGPFRSPCTIRLPPPNGEVVEEGDPRARGPQNPVRCTAQLPPEVRTKVTFWFTGPSPSHRVTLLDTEEPEGDFVAGHYTVLATADGYARHRSEIEVTPGQPLEVKVTLQPLPTARIAVRDLPNNGTVELRTRDGSRDITDAIASGTPIPIDAAEEYAIDLDVGEERRRCPASGHALLAAPQTFAWYRDTRVHAELVDESGAPVVAKVALVAHIPQSDCDGEPEPGFDPRPLADVEVPAGRVDLATTLTGMAWLSVQPQSKTLRPRLVPVPLPARGDDVDVDLGRIVLGKEPQLRLLAADGSPLRLGAALLRTGTCDLREHCYRLFALAADGSWIGSDLRVGDGILVPANDEPVPDAASVPMVALPLRARIDADGPRQIQVPRGSVKLVVTGDDGEKLAATVLLRECMWPVNGELRIAQVPNGTHRLFVGADGHRAAVVDFDLEADGAREIRVALPRR